MRSAVERREAGGEKGVWMSVVAGQLAGPVDIVGQCLEEEQPGVEQDCMGGGRLMMAGRG